MILEDQNSIGSQAWEDRKEELDREIARHEAQFPGRAGEDLRGHGNDLGGNRLPVGSGPPPSGTPIVVGVGDLPSSGVDTAPTASFPTSFLIPEAAFVLGISERALRELIAKDYATALTTPESDVPFLTRAQLDRLDDQFGIFERGREEVSA